jgi:undecaprenyl phosphate-alpha-L-ara4N flippase subunit ArnE
VTPAATALLLGAILLEVLGQTLFKLGLMHRASPIRSSFGREAWHSGYLNRWIGLGMAAYAVELALWLGVLSTSRLSQAFPLLAMSYCGVAIASRLVFKELLRPSMVVGIGLITAGAAMVISSS